MSQQSIRRGKVVAPRRKFSAPVLFENTLRVRAKNMLAHEQAYLPHNPLIALVQKWLHPMRVSRYIYRDMG